MMNGFDSFVWGGGFQSVFLIVFVLIIGMFAVVFLKGIGRWNKNNQSPRLTVAAHIVSKRADVSHNNHHNAADTTGVSGVHSTSSTSYFITFEVQSGDRMEFHVDSEEYGMLAEKDEGNLTFQGTRYLSFERIKSNDR